MAENNKKTLEMPVSKEMNPSRGANGQNGHHSHWDPLSWYTAQRAQPGLTYGITMHGYVLLSSKK